MLQSDWLTKLQTFVPDWFYTDNPRAMSILDGMAAVMADHDLELQYLASQMFITTAQGSYLDLWGHDRGVVRNPGELDQTYALRIQSQNLTSRADLPDLVSLMNQLLIRGVVSIHEDDLGTFYCNRGTFLNRGAVIFQNLIKDAFTVTVDKQLHAPYAFESRGNFVGRQTFIGTTIPSILVLQNIMQVLNDNRAFGATFRIVERLN